MFNLQSLSEAVGQLRQDASYDAIVQSQQYVAAFRSRVTTLVTTLIQSDSLIKGQTYGPEDLKVSVIDTCNDLQTIREQYLKALRDAEASKLACFIPLDPNDPEAAAQAQGYFQITGMQSGLQTWSIFGGKRLSSGIPFESLSFTSQNKNEEWIPRPQYYNPTSIAINDLNGTNRGDWAVASNGFYFIYTVGSNRKLFRVSMITQGCSFGYSEQHSGLMSSPVLTWIDSNGDAHFTTIFTLELINNANSSSLYLTYKTKNIIAMTFTVDHLSDTISGVKYWHYPIASDSYPDNATLSILKADLTISSINRNCDSWNDLAASAVEPFVTVRSNLAGCYINVSNATKQKAFGKFLANNFGNISTSASPEYVSGASNTSFQGAPSWQKVDNPSASYALFTPVQGLDKRVMLSCAPDFRGANNAILSTMDDVITILRDITYEP